MHNKIEKMKASDLLFYLAFVAFLLFHVLSSTNFRQFIAFEYAKLPLFFYVVGLLSIKLLLDSSHKNLFFYFLTIGIFLLVGLHSENIRDLIMIGFFILEARNIDFDSILRVYIVLISVIILATVIANYLGIFYGDTYTVRTQGAVRSFLGFLWTTYGPNFYMSICLCIVYLTRKSKNIFIIYSVMFIANFWFYLKTDTKAVFFEVILLLIAGFVVQKSKLNITRFKIINLLYVGIFGMCSGVAVFFAYKYSGSVMWMERLNRALNYRLSLSKTALEEYGIGLLGNKITWVTENGMHDDYFYVDSSYLQLLIQYGVLVFIIVITIFTVSMYLAVKKKDSLLIICMLIIALHSITDPQLFNLVYNPFLLKAGIDMCMIFWIKRQERMKVRKRVNAISVID